MLGHWNLRLVDPRIGQSAETRLDREICASALDKIGIGIWIALGSRAKPNMTDAGRLCRSSAFCRAAIPFQDCCLLSASHWHNRDLDLFILESTADARAEWREPQVLICSRDWRKGGQKDWLDPMINVPRHGRQTPTQGPASHFADWYGACVATRYGFSALSVAVAIKPSICQWNG